MEGLAWRDLHGGTYAEEQTISCIILRAGPTRLATDCVRMGMEVVGEFPRGNLNLAAIA